MRKKLSAKIRQYHFELKHLLVLFIILAAAEFVIALGQKTSVRNFLVKTQDSYKKDSAERLANLTAISLELLLEISAQTQDGGHQGHRRIEEAFNSLLTQQLLLQHVNEVCLLVSNNNCVFAIDNGQVFYNYFLGNLNQIPSPDIPHEDAIKRYIEQMDEIARTEQIHSTIEGRQTFHVLVPFVPKGEYAGALYIKSSPDFAFVTQEVISSYNKFNLMFIGLIFLGLLAMFYISSYTMRERDKTQKLLFKERENQLEEHIHYQKEATFAKRIYHTHHKAEKVMGFVKEDLRNVSEKNIEQIKYRVTKYANFISRVIYDMKWFEPPIQAIRSPIFTTNLNEVIRFVVDNIFLRIAKDSGLYRFKLDLDKNLRTVPINEFVVWEILEPLFQNSLDHNDSRQITITVKTEFNSNTKESKIFIADNGNGISAELLSADGDGIKRIFQENISTKVDDQNSGYGCYLAFEIAKRCGWYLEVENLPAGGCQFTISIPNAT